MESTTNAKRCANNDPKYYRCLKCLFITLDQIALGDHLGGKNPVNCHKKSELQCFGCSNIFFSKISLLSHATHDHQMTESHATTLINQLYDNSESKNTEKPLSTNIENKTKQQTRSLNKIRILSDIRIPRNSSLQPQLPPREVNTNVSSFESRTLDISGPLEAEIINDLNDSRNVSDPDENNKTSTKSLIRKENCQKQKKIKNMGFKCNIDGCTVRLLAEENVAYHVKCHNGEAKDQSETFRCPECLEFFSTHWSKLAGHLWRSHLVDMELHTCDLCNYKTPSLSRLTNQHRGIHGNERPFVCEYCGKGFKTSKQLRTHKASHRLNDKDTVECEKCQRVFKNCRLLKLHNNSVHKDRKPFTCNFCNFSASTRSGLKLHLRKHTGEKPFSCDQCAYSTGDHNSLRRHKLRHFGLKPYNCPHCSYACIQSSTYKVHLKNKHPGLDHGLMFSCQYCSYRTLNQGNLQTHIAKHSESADKTKD